jgi:gamma-glutamylcyclotransferase (GGCT)/AIG2-like uncharacterized protein YtfP
LGQNALTFYRNGLFDVQPLDEDRCLIQLKTHSGKRHRGQYLTGVVMPFAAKAAGKALFLLRKGRRFWLSMSFDKELDVMNEGAVRQYAALLTDEELKSQVEGFDLGVKRQVTGSSGAVYRFPDEALTALAKLEDRRARYQRRYARIARANDRTAGTVKRKRTGGEKNVRCRISRYSEKKAQIQNNNSHHISKKIADSTQIIAAFEDLKISNMVRKPKATLYEDTGRWLATAPARSAGLIKPSIQSTWARFASSPHTN